MKRLLTKNTQSANKILPLPAIFLCTVLCGCTIGPWEKEFWEPPAATGAAPIEGEAKEQIPRATGDDLITWPKLGNVPDRTPPPMSDEEIEEEIQALKEDRKKALDAAERLARETDAAIDSAKDVP